MKHYNHSLINRLTISDFYGTDDEIKELILKCVKDFREKNKIYTCPICFEEQPFETFLVQYTSCGHKCCKKCWKENIQYQFDNLQARLHCFCCNQEIDPSVIYCYELLSKENYSIYSEKIINIVFKDDIINCPNCKHRYFNIRINSTVCPYCFYNICPKCHNLEHQSINMNCEEFERYMLTNNYINLLNQREQIRNNKYIKHIKDKTVKSNIELFKLNLKTELQSKLKIFEEKQRQKQLLKDEEENQKWLNNNTKQCPQCKAPIYKNGGCNHMTCRNCKYEFCWICCAKYYVGHFSSTSKCKQFDDGFRGDDYGLEQYI